MRILRIAVIIFILISLVGCVAVLTLSDVANLRKGMSQYEARGVTELEPKFNFQFQYPEEEGDDIEALVYDISSGTYISNYYFMFINNELEFWGYPHEFARSNKKKVNQIVKIINEKTKVAEEERKAQRLETY